MNKDEMINNIATSIGLACTSIELDLKDRQEIAKTLYALGCRKVSEDEIVIKKRQYEQLKKYNRDRKRLRLRWQQAKQEVKDTKKKTKQEAAKEILRVVRIIYSKDRGYTDWVNSTYFGYEYKRLCKKFGYELEDMAIIKDCAKKYGIKIGGLI